MNQRISNTEDNTVIVTSRAKLHEIIANGSLEFDEWTSLISEVEKSYPDSIEDICLVYDSFLSEFPLCSGYWRKYVNHNIRLSTLNKVVEFFERAVLSATYSVDLWVDYCNFGTLSFEDPSDVRRLFKRALSFVGKDYLSYALWDRYIEFEFSLKHWSSLAHIYIQTLRFPTKKLHHYHNSFKKLVEIWEAEMESDGNNLTGLEEPTPDNEASIHCNQNDIVCIIKDLLDPSTGSARSKVLQNYKSIGESYFQEASKLNEVISCFESRIKRPYFHVKPLDTSQLENWHQYLDFAELHRDLDWAVKLYERCLIPCTNYPEFWMRYVDFAESKGGREIANLALERATQIFLKRIPVIQLFNARFKEHIGDAASARATLLQCSTEADSEFVENVMMRSNMERRLGNFTAASTIYKEAIEMAAKIEKWHILPILYIHFSQLKYVTTGNEDDVRDILIDGIKHVPCCKLLIEELIKFAITHGGSRHINVIDAIVADAVSSGTGLAQGLTAKDGEGISRLYIEFVDLCGTVHDVRKAWNRHIKLFPLSVRTTLFGPSMRTKQWKIDMKAEETVVSLPRQPSGDSSPPGLIQSSLEEKKLSSPEINDSQAGCPAIVHFSDQKLLNYMVQESPQIENHDEVSNHVKVDTLQSGESDNIYEVSQRVSDPSRDVTEPDISLDLVSQVANGTEHNASLLELSEKHHVWKECGQESEQDLKPSLEKLSLDPQDSKSPGPISPTSDDSIARQNTSLSDGGLLKSEPTHRRSISNENMLESCQADVDSNVSSTVSIQATISSQTNRWHASPSSSSCNQNVMAGAFPQQPEPGNSGKNWHHRSDSDRFRRDTKFGFRGHSHRRPHKQRQSSPQRAYQGSEKGSQMLRNQDYQSQRHRRSSQNKQAWQEGQVHSQYPASTHTDLPTAPQAWPTHDLQQQNLSPACQPQPPVQPAFYGQPQISQNSIQSNEQHGNLQNNQAYNQIWQHYYYQQQQPQLLWPQQQLHLQPQQQEFLQQQYQQQLLQMQYLQQQQWQFPYQQQQQQGQMQPQQLPQQPSYQQPHLVHVQPQQQFGVIQPQPQSQRQQYYHQQQTLSAEQNSREPEQGDAKHQINTSQD